ncbi:hypothetical protein [Miltoncostaea marina]|uniref:hypothetical protein n=1 Tax=Miltoncostaea marina TaxID=2843215 RepID=UPI001C3E5513|nr:hypothetical protein [Miltoncostaea marina]
MGSARGYDAVLVSVQGVRGIVGSRGRVALAVALVIMLVVLVAPAFVAGRYSDGPGGAEVGGARLDQGWAFLYHAVRLSRGAELGSADLALVRARGTWAGAPAVAEDVELVYSDGAFTVPVPPGGTPPAPDDRVAEPRSRLGWVVHGRVGTGPRQMIGLIDYASGRVAWDIRPLPEGGA